MAPLLLMLHFHSCYAFLSVSSIPPFPLFSLFFNFYHIFPQDVTLHCQLMKYRASSLPMLMIMFHAHFHYDFIARSKINLLLIRKQPFFHDHASKQLSMSDQLLVSTSIIIIIKILTCALKHLIDYLFFFFLLVPMSIYFFQFHFQCLHLFFSIFPSLFTQDRIFPIFLSFTLRSQ